MKSSGIVLLAFYCAFSSCNLAAAQTADPTHIFVVMEHNSTDADVIGNSSMPYLNSLAFQYQTGVTSYSKTGSSNSESLVLLSRYLSGARSLNNVGTDNNIAQQLLSAGMTWKSYAEGLPGIGYMGGDVGGYVRARNPFSFLPEVVNSVQIRNLVPLTELASDLQNDSLPNLSFVVPDIDNDGHDGNLGKVDSWLKTHIAPILTSASFKQDGILFIVFERADARLNGGDVFVVVVRPKQQPGESESANFQPPDMLKDILTGLGVATYSGEGASAPEMAGVVASSGNSTTGCIGTNCPVGPLKGCVYSHSNNKYQAVEFRMNYHACVPFDAKLYYGAGCNPHNQADEFGYGRNLCLGGGWIFWFSDFPNQLNTSALWTIGNQKACFNYSNAPSC
jgi:hypothetical protein